MKVKVLITGHEGFIGRNALRILSDSFEMIPYHGDIREWYSLAKVDVVLHLAALAGVRKSWECPDDYWETNVTASKKIFDWCEGNHVRCVYASSSSAYEWWLNPYAASKKAMEAVACKDSLGMRFHTVYGPDSRPDMFYDRMLKGNVKYVTEHQRDWTHIEDLVEAIRICLINTQLKGIVDIGTGDPVRVFDVAEAFGLELPIKNVTGERDITHADTSILRSLGWEPKRNIMEEVKNARKQKEAK